jgi:thiamine-monophosphate kinase
MNNNICIKDLGELKLIKLIEERILEKTGKELIQDDSFFYEFDNFTSNSQLVFNSDMFVSTTDAPPQMSHYQMGRKSVIMNISDLMVKGVEPKGIMISLGLPNNLRLSEFKELMEGIIDYCIVLDLDYIGGDINETKEIIINPTVFGSMISSNIIFRKGIEVGNYLVANGKFGLTGVGLDILINKKGSINDFQLYKRSIMSVLEPENLGKEALILAEKSLVTASIDSSDGLSKSLLELMKSNSNIGFEIELSDELIDQEASKYSEEYNIPLGDLIFSGGEEFIHIFTITPNNFHDAQKLVKTQGGKLFRIGKVISERKIYIKRDGKKAELKKRGYEHFK